MSHQWEKRVLWLSVYYWTCNVMLQPAKAECGVCEALRGAGNLYWAMMPLQYFCGHSLDDVCKKISTSANDNPFLELGSILREEGACIGVWYGGNTNLGSREAGAPLPPSLRGSIGTGRPGLEWPPIPNAPPPSSHIWAPPKLITFSSSFDGFILKSPLVRFSNGCKS